jgi:hypothetical protein
VPNRIRTEEGKLLSRPLLGLVLSVQEVKPETEFIRLFVVEETTGTSHVITIKADEEAKSDLSQAEYVRISRHHVLEEIFWDEAQNCYLRGEKIRGSIDSVLQIEG